MSHKDKHGTLIFPTCKLEGIFYSEELKFARDLCYSMILLNEYMFKKKANSFDNFINDLYENRLEVKMNGDEAMMSLVYKI